MSSLSRRLAAEGIGTAFLLIAVIGSGIMGERLAAGNTAVALLANSAATGCALAVLILVMGRISGAHFNPAVTLVAAIDREIRWADAAGYVATQITAAYLGVALAHLMFGEPIFSAAVKARTGPAQWLAEAIATFGLLVVILGCARRRPDPSPWAVATYIAGAYWFTSSTSFANPAVTMARAASNTFAGIRPDHVAAFIAAQLLGAVAAMMLMRWLLRNEGMANP